MPHLHANLWRSQKPLDYPCRPVYGAAKETTKGTLRISARACQTDIAHKNRADKLLRRFSWEGE